MILDLHNYHLCHICGRSLWANYVFIITNYKNLAAISAVLNCGATKSVK